MRAVARSTALSVVVMSWGPTGCGGLGGGDDPPGDSSSADLVVDCIGMVPEQISGAPEGTTRLPVGGELEPFTGPINKQDGSVWLEAGQTAPDGDLLGMNFYVEGIEGVLPK